MVVGLAGVKSYRVKGIPYLDTCAGVANDDNGFPGPVIVVTDRDDDVAEVHDDDVWDHGWETHLGLTNAVVLAGRACGEPIGQRTGGEQADEGAYQHGKVGEA